MTDLTVTIAGQTFAIKPMEQGQIESLFRIWRSIAAAGDEDGTFYARQIGRMGDLIDGLLTTQQDVDRLDRLFTSGQTSTQDIIKLVLAAYQGDNETDGDVPAIVAKKKPAVAVTKRAPAKKATRARK